MAGFRVIVRVLTGLRVIAVVSGFASSDLHPLDETRSSIARASPQCSANPKCGSIAGDCCPTTDGVMLDCCAAPPAPLPTPPSGSCIAKNAENWVSFPNQDLKDAGKFNPDFKDPIRFDSGLCCDYCHITTAGRCGGFVLADGWCYFKDVETMASQFGDAGRKPRPGFVVAYLISQVACAAVTPPPPLSPPPPPPPPPPPCSGTPAMVQRLESKVAMTLEGMLVATSLIWLQRGIDDDDCIVLCQVIRDNAVLNTLQLDGNKIGDVGAAAIGKALKFNSVLYNLDLELNQIGDQGAIAIAEALKVNSALNNLNLSGNAMGDAGATALADALKVNTALKELRLSGNQIGDSGAKAISDALVVNTALNELNLGGNKIGDAGAAAIGEALKVNSALKRLFLDVNKIGDAGAAAIGEALKVNSVLNTLNLFNNKIGDVGATAIGEALKVNSVLNELYLSFNDITDAGKQALRAAKEQRSAPLHLEL